MIEARSIGTFCVFILIIAGTGAIGGFISELLIKRAGGEESTGRIEPIRRVNGYLDLGWLASVIVGAIAAFAALWIFPPRTLAQVANEAGEVVAQGGIEYDLIKTAALALIIGTIGSAFLVTVQTRALAAAKDQQAKTTENLASQQLDDLKGLVDGDAGKLEVVNAIDAAKRAVTTVNR